MEDPVEKIQSEQEKVRAELEEKQRKEEDEKAEKKNKEENILSVPDDESKARYLFDIILNQQFNGNNIVEYIGNSNTAGPAINTYYNTKEFLNSGGFENVFITVNGYLF